MFTADAMHKKTFEIARKTGSFLVAQVKANQQTLHDTIEE